MKALSLTYCGAERAYLLRVERGNHYRLGPWPELASAVRRGAGAPWQPSREAGNRVLAALLADFPPRWFRGSFRGWEDPGVPTPRFRRWQGDVWVERSTGQAIMPWAIEEDAERLKAERHDASRDFQSVVPARLRVLVKRFGRGQVSLLRLLSAVPETEAIAVTNPALFVLLAQQFDRAAAGEIQAADVKALLGRPRTEILTACTGQPATHAEVALIGKAPPGCLDAGLVPNLARALHQPAFGHCLPHLSKLTHKMARVLAAPRLWPMLTPSLLREIRDYTGWFRFEDALAALHTAAKQVESEGGGFPRFKSADDVRRFLTVRLPQLREVDPVTAAARLPDETPLPAPPVPGDGDIVPLLTAGALRAEGRERANCAGEDWQVAAAMGGQIAFFAMQRPERATLMITRLPESVAGAAWVIEEIRGYENQLPRLATVAHAVKVLGLPAEPVWYPPSQTCWWGETPFAFMPPAATQSA